MGSIDNLNSSIIALLAGQSFIGEFVSTISHAEINVSIHTNQLCTLIIYYSSDGLTYELNETFNITPALTQYFNFTPKLRFYKIQLNNGIDNMGFLNLSSILKTTITYKPVLNVSLPEAQITTLTPLPTVEPYLQISKSLVPGSYPVYLSGENPGISGLEDLWSSSVATWIPPTTATPVYIYSNSAADTAAGTGARAISISGLDGSYNQVSEVLILNGTTSVATTKSYWIIHRMVVIFAGSSNSAVGTISSVWSGGSPIGPNITPPLNASQSCIYQVPAGYSLYITNYKIASHDGGKSTGYLMAKPLNGVYSCIELCPVNVFTCAVIREFQPPMKILQYTTIKFQTTINTPGMACFGSIDGILIAN